MEELLYSGELEKWANTVRGKTWRKFVIRLTNRKIRWHLPSELDENVFLGEIEVSRIVNAKLETKSELVEPGYTVFTVQDPAMSHEFRSSSQRISEDWVQHIKNATLPKTRRKKLPDSRERLSSLNSLNSESSNKSNLSSRELVTSNSDKPAMVTEIIGGTHIERPTDPAENEKSEKTTNTILIMNAEVEGGGFGANKVPRKQASPRSLRGEDTLARNNRYSFSLSNFYPFSNRPSVDSDISEPGSEEHQTPILREGYLIKQGQKIKSWRRRWFTLSRSVLIYRDEEGTTVKGRIWISEVNLVKTSVKYPDKKFLFEIITKNRTYYVTASSQDEMTSWTDALKSVTVSSSGSNYDAASLSSS